MRSTAAASLLTVCGLCAPLESGSYVQRFDNIFVRGASADVPTESKSAFGAEMADVAALMRACGKDSLVFVDEVRLNVSDEYSHASRVYFSTILSHICIPFTLGHRLSLYHVAGSRYFAEGWH